MPHPSRPPPFFRQFILPSFFAGGFRLRLCNGSLSLRRFRLSNRLQRPRWRRASRRQVTRKPQLLGKFLFLDSGAGLFRNLIRDRALWLRSFSDSRFRMAFSSGPLTGPLFFIHKAPDGTHQMGNRDVNTAFPENLRDPVDTEATAMCFEDLVLILSQCVDLGLLSITAAFSAARDLKKILGSGFEMIRISQCESTWVFWGL